MRETLKDFESVYLKGQETAAFPADLDRIKAVIRPIANALYFKDYGTAYPGTWNVFITSLTNRQEFETGRSGWELFTDFMMRVQFKPKDVPQPEVFSYGVFEMVGGIALELLFYDSFFIHCWGKVP